MLGTLSAVAYRAYLPAYLEACLADEDPYDKYGADLRGYLLATLKQRPYQSGEHREAEARERLSLLDAEQRAAVASILRYLETRWWMKEAGEVLRDWST
jgi:dsDNA-binding SOS-regulon protein